MSNNLAGVFTLIVKPFVQMYHAVTLVVTMQVTLENKKLVILKTEENSNYQWPWKFILYSPETRKILILSLLVILGQS